MRRGRQHILLRQEGHLVVRFLPTALVDALNGSTNLLDRLLARFIERERTLAKPRREAVTESTDRFPQRGHPRLPTVVSGDRKHAIDLRNPLEEHLRLELISELH